MGRPSEAETLVTAWRALTGSTACEGWRTIPVADWESYRMLAGRHFPGNEEAVLVGLRSVRVPPIEQLPEGNGFVVRIVDFEIESENRIWFALVHQAAGSLEMFAVMAADVASTLDSSKNEGDERLLKLFLERIRAWQSFMQRSGAGVLSPEAEVGLHGELVVLSRLIESGLPAVTAIESWRGPLDGIQDFQVGSCAIEVKTTISSGGFSATIISLEQLDNSLVAPLFLAGVRLRLDEKGLNLQDRVACIRNLLQFDSAALNTFEARLLYAGFSSSMSVIYPRRFNLDRVKIFFVDESFPKLTGARVPHEIRKVRYEIDLELVASFEIPFEVMLQSIGGF